MQSVPIATTSASRTASVPTVDSTEDAASSVHKPSNSPLPPRIGIDLMGSDTLPIHLLEASLALAKEHANGAAFHLFGSEEMFTKSPPSHVLFERAPTVITMEDDPLKAVRSKRDSSMCQGILALKEKRIDAFISFGNTGALMASSKLILNMLPTIDRPALLALLPAQRKEVAVLDVGANTTYKPEHLFQFALMGIAYQKSCGIENPKVGLLNIGSESKKGSPLLREAHHMLRSLSAFVGNIEGREALASNIDVLVTDGITGNVFLKTAEGIAGVILDELSKPAFKTAQPSELQRALAALKKHLTYSEYPGALLCGVNGIVMKCHGAFSNIALQSTVQAALRLVLQNYLSKIKNNFS